MREFHESSCNGFGDIWWTNNPIYFSSRPYRYRRTNSKKLTTNSFSDYLNGNYAPNLFMFPTCEAEILHTTTNLKASTSEGFDNISTKMLKQTMKEVATPLAHVVNISLSHGIFPNDMKLAKIVPILKNGNTELFNNYRPISILPAFSKILEKIVCNRLLHFLETKTILYKHQYGFRKNSANMPTLAWTRNYLFASIIRGFIIKMLKV